MEHVRQFNVMFPILVWQFIMAFVCIIVVFIIIVIIFFLFCKLCPS